jgi:two-component sensor histidine kinase/ABC-type amino acid transport substrate-binding protein
MLRYLISTLIAVTIICGFPFPLSAEEDRHFDRPLIARGDYDYPPFEFIDDEGHPSGFNVELIEAIAKEMGIEVIVDLGLWSEVRNELASGQVDFITGMYQTEERERHFDFSAPHNVISHAIYTRKGSDISLPSDLAGRMVYVQSGDVMQEYLRERIPNAFIVKARTYRDALIMLNSDDLVDAALLSRIQAEYLIREEGLSRIESAGPPIYPRKYSFAVKNGDSDLIAILNDGLALVRKKGVYDQLYAKWFGHDNSGLVRFLTFRNILIILIPLVFIIGIIFSWIWSLRRTVRQKTGELKRELAIRRQAEWRFRSVFEGVPVSIWEEDISAVRELIENLKAEGVRDFAGYVDEHPEVIEWMVSNIHVIDVNPATLEMHEADSREQILGSFSKVETDKIVPFLRREFIAIAEGEEHIQDETTTVTFKGNEKTFLTNIFIPRAGSGGLTHMLVSMVDISGIKAAEKKLASSLAEKDVLLKELHHRVKNNMQLMSSLINLQSRSVEDEKFAQLIKVSENRIRAMALIHELLYQTDDFTSIELGNYLQTLAHTIMGTFQEDHPGKAVFRYEGTEAEVSIDTAIPCGLIVNELISNAVEHAFPGDHKGTIELTVQHKDGFLEIAVCDDGVGMKNGGSPEGRHTMGLTLVEALSSQLKGSLTNRAGEGKGTRFLLKIGEEHIRS